MTQADEPDWDRWHDLLDIRARRGLTPDEEAEYQKFLVVVDGLDAEEAVIAEAYLAGCVEKHMRIIASIERLTEAVKKAAKR